MILANLILSETLRWTNIPSRAGRGGGVEIVLATETGLKISGLVGHLARMQTKT